MTWRDLPAHQDQPAWVKTWRKARAAGDMRLFPEQQPGYEQLDREWHAEGGHGLSGYDWSGELETRGLIPAKDRARYENPDSLTDLEIPF